MGSLLKRLKELKKSEIKKVVDKRILEFEKAGKQNANRLFEELCFCLLTANFNAEKSIRIQKEIGEGFLTMPKNKLAARLKVLGHRYPNIRASYIVEARKHKAVLKKALKEQKDTREWLVKNVKGLGYKEASHFLRNIGYKDYSIIDFHIIDLLNKEGVMEKPKTWTRNKYLETEIFLKNLGKKSGLNLSELDLYLWYLETGKVLK